MRRFALVAVVAVAASACGSTTPDVSPSQTPAAAVVATPSPSTSPTLSPSIGPTPTPSPTPSPTPPADVAPLDGVPAPAATGQRLVIAVMVGNNVQARPQYGFNKASIVYQAPADGGEDRYMLLFQEQNAKRIEPVRSGRPYFVNWASEYRSAFAHYGGDAKTLAYLPTIHDEVLYNVDALFGSAGAFHRDTSRKAPDNAVTSSTAVRRLAVRHGAPAMMPGEVELRPFADDLPADQRPAKGSIKIPYGRGVVSYAYDAASNAYLRSVAGKAHKDAADGKRVTARNVVVLFMRLSIDPESEPGHNRPVLDHIGSGKALVFRDGHVIPGTWSKKSAAGLTRFLDAAGKEITMVPGRIFIQVVPKGTDVTYKARAAD